jgi:hypothetical protein
MEAKRDLGGMDEKALLAEQLLARRQNVRMSCARDDNSHKPVHTGTISKFILS